MTEITPEDIAAINSFPKLVSLLRDKMEWPIPDDYTFDDVVYEYEPKDLGFLPEHTAEIREIHQLRPLSSRQPWGIFFVSFENKNISVAALRRMLSNLVIKSRPSAQKADQQSWLSNDLIFVTNFGDSQAREIAFVHFSENQDSDSLAVMKVLGWNSQDTIRHNEHVGNVLSSHLRWPEDTEDSGAWRSQWCSAFQLRQNEVINTSKDLSRRLAELASQIRIVVNDLLDKEKDTGRMRQMHEAFRKNLIQDLDADGFADMFAQTICYGMLAARISKVSGDPSEGTDGMSAKLVADNLADMVPPTNPFLKELFGSFLSLGGRDKRKGMDFDELGIHDVVDMLNAANMEAVLRDFGDKNPKEDPVIHFYELFLKEYDPEKRVQRGVFYTPRPVVNFIVRGVDEVLRTEFGLPLGLADTSTWAELAAANDKIDIPDHIDPQTPFVQILDPATGTGTFIVETIDLIYNRMVEHWSEQGLSEAERVTAWNDYVPKSLLPRLTAFELMMAPYAIAHMKVGLKLSETGYTFGSDERARIFLTNALEPARDLDMEFAFMSEVLAHEARAANHAKSNTPYTAIIGNPPYATLSANKGKWLNGLMADYKKSLGGEIQIQALTNDYVKFFRLAQYYRDLTTLGVIGFVTDNSFIDGILFTDFRKSLLNDATFAALCDLGGNNRRRSDGDLDEGVFDIRQGTCVMFSGVTAKSKNTSFIATNLKGARDEKYDALFALTLGSERWLEQSLTSSKYSLKDPEASGKNISETSHSLKDIFSGGTRGKRKLKVFGAGVATRQDTLTVDFTEIELSEKLNIFLDENIDETHLREKFSLCTTAHFNFHKARKNSLDTYCSSIQEMLYRPFDKRFVSYHPDIIGEFRNEVFRNIDKNRIALLTTRRVTGGGFSHCFATDGLAEYKSATHDRNTQVFPLYISLETNDLLGGEVKSNIGITISREYSQQLSLKFRNHFALEKQQKLGEEFQRRDQDSMLGRMWDGRGDLQSDFGPQDIFDYIYAILHSPGYRARYASFLKSDFPRIPTPKTKDFFAQLISLGQELVSLHLVKPDEATILADPDIRFAGSGEARVKKGYPKYENGKVMINASRWFEDVPRETWEFPIGGYQVCDKWLKYRAEKNGRNPSPGRVLTDEDILHYRRTVTALTETRRIMTEIDKVIESHGGWPDAFAIGAKNG